MKTKSYIVAAIENIRYSHLLFENFRIIEAIWTPRMFPMLAQVAHIPMITPLWALENQLPRVWTMQGKTGEAENPMPINAK